MNFVESDIFQREKWYCRASLSVYIEDTAGRVGECFGFPKILCALFADAEHMGRHGEQILNLLTFHRKGKPDGHRFDKFEAGKFRHGVLFLEIQLIVNDSLEAQQMVFCRQHLEVVALGLQHPGKFLRKGNGKKAGQQVRTALGNGNVGGGGTEPLLSLIFCRGAAHRFLGNIQSGERAVQSVCQPGGMQ